MIKVSFIFINYFYGSSLSFTHFFHAKISVQHVEVFIIKPYDPEVRQKDESKNSFLKIHGNKSRRRTVRRKANTIETEFIAYRFNIIT